MATIKRSSIGAMAATVGIATAIAGVILILGAVVGAFLLDAEVMKLEQITWFSAVSCALAGGVGSWYASGVIGRMKMQICLITGAAILALQTLIALVLFGGDLAGWGRGAITVLIGSVAVALLSLVNKKRPKFKVRKNAYR